MIVALLAVAQVVGLRLSCGTQVNGIVIHEPRYKPVAAYYGLFYGRSNRFEHARLETCDPRATLNATAPGPICVQFGYNNTKGRVESEDCLLLDVYTPVNVTRPAQVFVWIHGGGNCFGSSTLYTDLSHLTALEDVIVVSVQYRLGAFGYLATSGLSQEQGGHSGNYGISDLIIALKFVRREIANFGGDPNRVTLLGQSSGGTNILALLAAPAATGYYAAAISLSGSPNITMSLGDTEAQNAALMSAANVSCQTPACLRAASIAEIVDVFVPLCAEPMGLPSDPKAGVQWPGMVVVDGLVVTTDSLSAAQSYPVPTIISTLANEVELFIDPSTVPPTMTAFEQALAASMWRWSSPNATAQRIVQMYSSLSTVDEAYTQFITDYTIACGSLALSRAGSAVVAVYVTAGPANPAGVLSGSNALHYPFHLWDYMLAFEAWGLVSSIMSTSGAYMPYRSDISTGAALRKLWTSLDGKIDPRFCVSDEQSGLCVDDLSFGGRVLVDRNASGGGVWQRCNVLSGFGLDARRWWWTNRR